MAIDAYGIKTETLWLNESEQTWDKVGLILKLFNAALKLKTDKR